MNSSTSSSDLDSSKSNSRLPTSAPSSPPPLSDDQDEFFLTDEKLVQEEEEARAKNDAVEEKRKADLLRKRRNRKAETKAERDAKARELDELLMKSAAFSDILTKKTQVLGRVGSCLDGKKLGEHDLQMAKQPTCMVGGTMREYQLEGLTWMYEICSQGMSGILADEMGLGKTIQTIALIALLREQEDYLGPHLIVAPLSTLSNWIDEFEKWVPSIPIIMYHGNQAKREELFRKELMAQLKGGRPTTKFPVVCTSYEMVLLDQYNLSRINWEFIIIDEGHRMKNADAKLFQQLRQFSSATRLLITGTPLQNNLKELWSLLHFLLPSIFTNWEAFESWFDFSDLQDEHGTQEFIGDTAKQQLVKKIHLVLQPLLLRRIKQDVAAYLPKKREYVLFAPMTKEQTDLYNVLIKKYKDVDSDEEKMSDDEFEAKLADELASKSAEESEQDLSTEEMERAKAIDLAKKQIAQKKLGNTLVQLRLACNSPHNFYSPWATSTDVPIDESIITSSGKMLLLDRLLARLLTDGHKVLIFSQFKTQLDILEDYCREFRGWNVCRIDGGVAHEVRRDSIKAFNADDDFKIFLLSTRAGGQGINLASADTVILFDSDFNPQQDLQAQDRCHRIGQTRPVIVYRLATKGTVEERLLLSADAKRRLEKLVIRKGGFRTMGQKMDRTEELLDSETLRTLLLRDGEVYKTSGGVEILSEEDLDTICDRSEEAFERAARGDGDADAFRVVETGADSIKMAKRGVV
ncbi:Lymphoid-specific helicase [Escovopsis weberi]|uniref:Lymphoid-specific helicase n=1 Tax=Escovopsis weberi TaxID=150374 RepID=A0A0M8N101_ESCWE|nr:Lymphoid-specific helicase [Escovopsis weberi]